MRRTEFILIAAAAALLTVLTGCGPLGKPAAAATPLPVTNVASAPAPSPNPAPPPAPLSMPQTQVDLPPDQPIPAGALDVPPPEREPAPPPAPVAKPPRQRNAAPAAAAAHPETTGPVVAAPPPETERAPIGEILPANEQRQLTADLASKRTEARKLLENLNGNKSLTQTQRNSLRRARSFLSQSDDAEKKGDMKQAEVFADMALVFARELNGK